MALFHGATSAGPCESMFAVEFPEITADMDPVVEFFCKHKSRLLFSPDCKYRKLVFEKFLRSVGEAIRPYGTLGCYIGASLDSDDRNYNYTRLRLRCQSEWYHWGRMGHWCFAEALARFTSAPIDPPNMEFADGASHRAGWAFCIGRDDLSVKALSQTDVAYLERTAAEYMRDRQWDRAGYFTLETACCNYKRQHRGSRYGGCYIDEQHVEITQMQRDWPEHSWLWDLYMDGRQRVIPHELLYENHPQTSRHAYQKDWNSSLERHGRMPRVEAWANGDKQKWEPLKILMGGTP